MEKSETRKLGVESGESSLVTCKSASQNPHRAKSYDTYAVPYPNEHPFKSIRKRNLKHMERINKGGKNLRPYSRLMQSCRARV